MAEPIYRWVCTACDASGVAENSELARLAVDLHVAVEHGSADAAAPAVPAPRRPRRWTSLLRRLTRPHRG